MEIHEILTQIGLNKLETDVYLATLELGESTVLPIAKKAGIKRTYCYDILAELQKKNLVTYFEKNGRRRYVAEDPVRIGQIMQEKLKEFHSILPELKSIQNSSSVKPKIRYYEGKEGIISIYENFFLNSKEIFALASPNHIYKYIGDYFSEYSAKILAKKVKVRELVTQDGNNTTYLASFKKPLQEARVLPKNIKLSTDMVIFDNKLAMISYSGELHAIVIESSSIIETQKMLFETIWEISK